MIRLFLIFIAVLVANHADAGGFYYQRYYQPKYAVQQFQAYYVGAPVRIEAMVQAEMQSSPEYQEFQQYKEFRGEFEAFMQWKQQQAAIPADALPQQLSAMDRSCVRCHSGDEPKGSIDLTGAIDADTLKALKTAILEDRMPPPNAPERKEWGPDGAGAVLSEAVDRLE